MGPRGPLWALELPTSQLAFAGAGTQWRLAPREGWPEVCAYGRTHGGLGLSHEWG